MPGRHSLRRMAQRTTSSKTPHFLICWRRVPSGVMPTFPRTRPDAGLRTM
jgi:hypothetical protein